MANSGQVKRLKIFSLQNILREGSPKKVKNFMVIYYTPPSDPLVWSFSGYKNLPPFFPSEKRPQMSEKNFTLGPDQFFFLSFDSSFFQDSGLSELLSKLF